MTLGELLERYGSSCSNGHDEIYTMHGFSYCRSCGMEWPELRPIPLTETEKAVQRAVKIITMTALAFMLATGPAAAGDKPDQYGCYQVEWVFPWLLGQNCSHPALGDPDHIAPVPDKVGQPRKEPPPHCSYESKD